MVEPVGTTLAAVALFAPIFEACERLVKGWRDMHNFGQDLDYEQAELEMQFVLFKRVSLYYREDLKAELDLNDSEHEGTRTVKRYLEVIKHHFEECDNIMFPLQKRERLGKLLESVFSSGTYHSQLSWSSR